MKINLRVSLDVSEIVGRAFKELLKKRLKDLFFEKLFQKFDADSVEESEIKMIKFLASNSSSRNPKQDTSEFDKRMFLQNLQMIDDLFDKHD